MIQPCPSVTTATGTSATIATTALENARIAAASENAATAVSKPTLTLPRGANGAGTEMGSSPRSFVPTAPWPTRVAFATRWAVGAACLGSITRAAATPRIGRRIVGETVRLSSAGRPNAVARTFATRVTRVAIQNTAPRSWNAAISVATCILSFLLQARGSVELATRSCMKR